MELKVLGFLLDRFVADDMGLQKRLIMEPDERGRQFDRKGLVEAKKGLQEHGFVPEPGPVRPKTQSCGG
jgi:hypothetical protein